MPRIRPVLTLREMPGSPAVEFQQLGVTLADNGHRRARRYGIANETANTFGQLSIGRLVAALVRLPRDTPFRLPSRTVRVIDVAILAGRSEPADRRLAEVVHEDVLGARDPVSRLPHAHRVIVVLEEADFETLIERTDRVPHLTPQRRAKHDHCADVEQLARMRLHVLTREAIELAVGGVRNLDFGLVAGPVRHGPKQSDSRVGKMIHDTLEPTLGDDGVVVEQDHDVAATARDAA